MLVPQHGQPYHKQYIVWYRTAALLIDGDSIWAVSHHDRATDELRMPKRDDIFHMHDELNYVVRKSDVRSKVIP